MENAKVLLVDDEEDFAATLAERMQDRGLTVDVASDGPEAIRRVEDTTYDAIVLDLAMPGMNGIETMKRLLAESPDLQIILLTGRATVRSGVEAMMAGAVEFLEKPADLNVLMEQIEKAQANRVLLTEKRLKQTLTDILQRKGW